MQSKPPTYSYLPAQKKHLFIEHFISILLIFRNYLTDLNIYIYYTLILSFFVIKYLREGNTAGSFLQYVSFIVLLVADYWSVELLGHVGVVIAVVNYVFLAPTVYTLPQYRPYVGLRDNYMKRNNKDFYWAQWYPVQSSQPKDLYQIPWNHTVQASKMAQYMNLKKKFLLKGFYFFTSHIQKYKLTFSKGTPSKYQGIILFSHGRTGTPILYSSLLRGFARKWKILSPQHSQVPVTPYTDLKQIKRYRQNQVKQRGQEIVYMSSKVGQSERLILMGHSYGCATILQAYHDMHLSVRKRVSHIVLLDPWLFPLPDAVVQDQIVCPILVLANQHFLTNKDIYYRNLQFIKRHSNRLIYICWKGGDHLHQTDMAFIVGNSLKKIKNSKEADLMNRLNYDAAEMFLGMEKVGVAEIQKFREKFSDYDVGVEYMPAKFSNKLNF